MKFIPNLLKNLVKNYFLETLLIIGFLVFTILSIFSKNNGIKFAREHLYPLFLQQEKKGTIVSEKYGTPILLSGNKNKRNTHKSASWCSKGEAECRRVLEKIYHKPFPTCRPDFLSNPVTGGSYNLELDCYNKDLKLAVEYNGKFHYEYTPYFHKSPASFRNQEYRDYLKKLLCEQNDITLIVVPYTIRLKDIEQYLRRELRKVRD